MAATSERVSVARDGHVLLIGVNRPETVAAQAPLGVQGTLANARAAAERAAVEHLAGLLPAILASEDAAEGVRSFLERRSARFTGR